jgi:hypothetical protein
MWHAKERRGMCTGFLVGKPEGKRELGRPKRRWEDGIRMDLREIGWGRVDWIQLAHDSRVERMYSSYSFTTSALDGVSVQRHAEAALYPQGKDHRYPLYRRLGGLQSRSGHRG